MFARLLSLALVIGSFTIPSAFSAMHPLVSYVGTYRVANRICRGNIDPRNVFCKDSGIRLVLFGPDDVWIEYSGSGLTHVEDLAIDEKTEFKSRILHRQTVKQGGGLVVYTETIAEKDSPSQPVESRRIDFRKIQGGVYMLETYTQGQMKVQAEYQLVPSMQR